MVTCALALATTAFAGTLVSPPANRALTGDIAVNCYAMNLAKKDVDVLLELVAANGSVVASETRTIPPGRTASSINILQVIPPVAGAHCKFSFRGGKKKVRGFMSLERTADLQTLFVTEAR